MLEILRTFMAMAGITKRRPLNAVTGIMVAICAAVQTALPPVQLSSAVTALLQSLTLELHVFASLNPFGGSFHRSGCFLQARSSPAPSPERELTPSAGVFAPATSKAESPAPLGIPLGPSLNLWSIQWNPTPCSYANFPSIQSSLAPSTFNGGGSNH
eukprot:Gb_06429 [translate_table: standard]